MKIEPRHDAPDCPGCESPTGTPVACRDLSTSPEEWPDVSPLKLFCPACGHEWTGNIWEISQAFWSVGANAQYEIDKAGT